MKRIIYTALEISCLPASQLKIQSLRSYERRLMYFYLSRLTYSIKSSKYPLLPMKFTKSHLRLSLCMM